MGLSASTHTVTLYHYTDEDGKDAILASRFIKMSTDTRRDAILGKGVYMTSMSPFDHTKRDIVRNNWTASTYKEKKRYTHFVFKVEVNASNLASHKKGDRDVYVYGEENFELDLLQDWTLYDWTEDTPEEIESGEFIVCKFSDESVSDYSD